MKYFRQISCLICALLMLFCTSCVSPQHRAEKSYEAGMEDLQTYSLQAALAKFSLAIKRDPKFVPAYIGRASVEIALHDFPVAVSDSDQAIQLAPGNEQALLINAAVKFQLKDYAGAESACDTLIRLDPDNERAFVVRGASRYYLKDFSGASNDLEAAIATIPDDPLAHECRGLMRARQRDWDGAITDLTVAVNANPHDAEALRSRAEVEMFNKDYEKSVADAVKMTQWDDTNAANAYRILAHDMSFLRDKMASLADADRAVGLRPSDSSSYVTRASIKILWDDFSGASNDLQTAFRLGPTNGEVYVIRAILEQKRGETNAALADYIQWLGTDPESFTLPEAYDGLGNLKEYMLQWQSALDTFRKAMAFNSPPEEARFHIYLLECRLGEKTQAQKELNAFIQSIPPSKAKDWTTSIAHFLAGTLNETDFLSQATSTAKRPTDIPRHICWAYYYEGMVPLLAGDPTKASAFFQKCVDTGEDNSFDYWNAKAELRVLKNP